mmetsp:Transcript_15415/g.25784  ORF Transcript_15415/g.25784 Transcript_15415/m.25784 type:complete len:253 (+) Transcript_15415:554-1312(+)
MGALRPESGQKVQFLAALLGPKPVSFRHFEDVVRVHKVITIRINFANHERIGYRCDMIGSHALCRPNSRRAGIICRDVEHPGFRLIDDCECLAALSFGRVAPGPVGSVKAHLHRQFAHELNRIFRSGGALKRNLRHLRYFNTSLASRGNGKGIELARTGGFSNSHLVLVHDAVATFEHGVGVGYLRDLGNIHRALPPSGELLGIALKVIRVPGGASIRRDNRRIGAFIEKQRTHTTGRPITCRHLVHTEIAI